MNRHSIIRTLLPLSLVAFLAAVACAGESPAAGAVPAGKPAATAAKAVTSPTTPATHASYSHMTSAKAAAMKVDLNTATREQLVALPGIGEAIADKIIAARPFKMKSELLSKGLVNKAQYAKLASRVVAKQEATASTH